MAPVHVHKNYEVVEANDLEDEGEVKVRTEADLKEMASHYEQILRIAGENPDREGLRDTPMRAAKAFAFFTKGQSERPKKWACPLSYFDGNAKWTEEGGFLPKLDSGKNDLASANFQGDFARCER